MFGPRGIDTQAYSLCDAVAAPVSTGPTPEHSALAIATIPVALIALGTLVLHWQLLGQSTMR